MKRARRFSNVALVCLVATGSVMPTLQAAEIVAYGFETGLEGWMIPDWAKNSPDYVATAIQPSSEHAEEGAASLKFDVAFPGGRWTGAYVERLAEVTDWTSFSRLSVSVYLPAEAPTGLKGRCILSVGESWQWTEMSHATSLIPGQWTTISANLKPGSMDWKFFPDDAFRKDIRKIGIRIESDKAPVYNGPVFVDNVRLLK